MSRDFSDLGSALGGDVLIKIFKYVVHSFSLRASGLGKAESQFGVCSADVLCEN